MPTQFDSEEDAAAHRDDPNYFGDRQPAYSARGVQVIALENGYGFRLENGEYLLGEGTWPDFDSQVSTASSRD